MEKLVIKDLCASVEGKEILKGVNLTINPGETVALLGPNGHGKSTLLNVLMGHPKYQVTNGSIFYGDKDVLKMDVDERAKAGLFLALQYPPEVGGVINADFLKSALNSKSEKPVSLYQFIKKLDNATKELKMPIDLANRSLNEGFSGGEKKRNEILQMLILDPSFVMLDEIDSGLDVDAIQIVSEAINSRKDENHSFLIISHYARLFNLVKPSKSAVMVNGKIVLTGGPELVEKIDQHGYEFLKTEYGVNIEKDNEQMNKVSIGTCATRELIK